jgi:hypothetical protein
LSRLWDVAKLVDQARGVRAPLGVTELGCLALSEWRNVRRKSRGRRHLSTTDQHWDNADPLFESGSDFPAHMVEIVE